MARTTIQNSCKNGNFQLATNLNTCISKMGQLNTQRIWKENGSKYDVCVYNWWKASIFENVITGTTS